MQIAEVISNIHLINSICILDLYFKYTDMLDDFDPGIMPLVISHKRGTEVEHISSREAPGLLKVLKTCLCQNLGPYLATKHLVYINNLLLSESMLLEPSNSAE